MTLWSFTYPLYRSQLESMLFVHPSLRASHFLVIPSAGYLRSQLLNFSKGLPAPDFPQGPGEGDFVGKTTPDDVVSVEARKAFGLEEYTEHDVVESKGHITEGEKEALFQGNMIIF